MQRREHLGKEWPTNQGTALHHMKKNKLLPNSNIHMNNGSDKGTRPSAYKTGIQHVYLNKAIDRLPPQSTASTHL